MGNVSPTHVHFSLAADHRDHDAGACDVKEALPDAQAALQIPTSNLSGYKRSLEGRRKSRLQLVVRWWGLLCPIKIYWQDTGHRKLIDFYDWGLKAWLKWVWRWQFQSSFISFSKANIFIFYFGGLQGFHYCAPRQSISRNSLGII